MSSNQQIFEEVSDQESEPDNLADLLQKLGWPNVKQGGQKASFSDKSPSLQLFLSNLICEEDNGVSKSMREPLIKALRLGIDLSGFDAQTQIAKSFMFDELPKMLLAQSNGIDKYDNIITCLSTDEMIASTIISATKLG